jgi:predicted deacetylase
MGRIPKPAQFLLRIDDLCPTVHARRWGRIRDLIRKFAIRPILAAIPANEDRELMQSPANPGFWGQMQEMQAEGATIALHGYHHLCSASGKSLVRKHDSSEFAGVSAELQREWIADGLKILRGHGLEPKLWVAPRHGFDRNTLLALRKEGIVHLSDGLARIPFRRGGLTWIPQQLGAPAPRSSGLWTICVHPNTAHRNRFEELRDFVARNAGQFTNFDRVVAEFPPEDLGPMERLREILATRRLYLRRRLRKPGRSRRA